MANQSFEREPVLLKTASVAAYAISGRPTRPGEISLSERSAAATRVLPRSKPREPEMPKHLADMIVDYIVQNAGNVTDLFSAWDKNKDGVIDKREFRNFLNAIGFIVPRECSDAFFEQFDDDGSGCLDYCELVRKTRKLAFERGKNPKPKPKPGNRSVSRFNEIWAERNIEHTKAFRRSVAKASREAAAKVEAEVAVRRAAQLEYRRERRDEARTLGTELLEPYRLRQQQDDRRDARTHRLLEEALAQDVIFLPQRLTARMTVSESTLAARLLGECTPKHTRERPDSRREAQLEVHRLPPDDDEASD